MADRYWVGGTDTWDSTAGTKWATTSGGTGGASVPTLSDDVYFDDNSFSANNQTVTIGAGYSASCNNLDCTSLSNTKNPTIMFNGAAGSSSRIKVYGNVLIPGSTVVNIYSTGVSSSDAWNVIEFYGTSNTIDFQGVNLTASSFTDIGMDFTVGSSYTLLGDIDSYARIQLRPDATLNTNGYDVNTYWVSGSFDSTLTLGASSVTAFAMNNGTTLTASFAGTINAGTSLISFGTLSSTGFSANLDGQSLHDVALVNSDNFTVRGTFSVNDLMIKNTFTKTIKFEAGKTITAATISKSTSALTNMYSTTPGSQYTLSVASGVVMLENVDLKDSNATGGATFVAVNSIDSGNNTGWLFIDREANIDGTSTFVASAVGIFAASALLTGDATASATGSTITETSATSNGDSTMTAFGRGIASLQILERKEFVARVFTQTGEYVGDWNNEIITLFNYSQEVNTAGSVVEVELTRTLDSRSVSSESLVTEDLNILTTEGGIELASFGEAVQPFGAGTTVDLNLHVEIYGYFGFADYMNTQDGDTIDDDDEEPIVVMIGSPNGRVMFTGFISDYNPNDGNSNTTKVTLTSYGSQLSNYVIEEANDITVPYLSKSPDVILKSLLDKAQALDLRANYSDVSIAPTNTTVSYTYKLNTYKEGVDKVLELSPSDWYWWYDMAQNNVWLQPKPTTPDHIFVRGKHIVAIDIKESLDQMVNTIYFKGGNQDLTGATEDYFFKKYEDTPSVTEYGRKLKIITDERVTNEETADILAQAEIDRYKDPRFMGTVIISAEQYLIEDIQLGQLVAFRNNGNFIDNLELQILALSYHPDYVTLQVGSLLPSVSKRVADIKRNLDSVNLQPLPNTPLS